MTFTELSSETDPTLLASVEFEHGGETYRGSVHKAEHGKQTQDETHVALPLQIIGSDVRRKLSAEIRMAYFAWKDPNHLLSAERRRAEARMDFAETQLPAQGQMEFE